MSLKPKIEAIIYAAEEPITLEHITLLVKDMVLAEMAAEAAKIAEDQGPAEQFSEEALPVEAPPPVDPSATAEVAEPLKKKRGEKKEQTEDQKIKARVRATIEELGADYDRENRGMEIRQVAGGYRMATRPEHHDVVRAFAKSLKPPVRLSLAALETLAVIAYKQPVTAPEISEIRGVDSSGVLATLLDRKLITTAGRKQVIGRPILYRTSKEFLLRFGLNDVGELPSLEEFEKLASDGQAEMFEAPKPAEPSPATQPDAPPSENEAVAANAAPSASHE